MPLTIVKCGGALLEREPFRLQRFVGVDERACIVHGAGARITRALAAAGIRSTFVGGRRVTSDEALPVVRRAFCDENDALCAQIGGAAAGVLGDELGLEAEPIPGLGHAGMLSPVVPPALWALLATDALPVIAPLARGPLNVNADDAAAVLAVALGADRLLFASDVPGVIVAGRVARSLSEREIRALGHELSGGIVPKLQAALHAAREGIPVSVGETAVLA